MEQGQGFIFTDAGILPMAPDGGFDQTLLTKSPAEMSPAAPASRVFVPERTLTLPGVSFLPAATPMARQSAEPLRPLDVVKAAKARAKQIRSELRAMKRLEKELAELDRLIAAAKAKPVAIVRHIDHARQAR